MSINHEKNTTTIRKIIKTNIFHLSPEEAESPLRNGNDKTNTERPQKSRLLNEVRKPCPRIVL